MTGTVVGVRDRGFGFIRGDDRGQYFFHASSVQGADFDAMAPGLRVEFDIEASERGPRATEVRLASAVVQRGAEAAV